MLSFRVVSCKDLPVSDLSGQSNSYVNVIQLTKSNEKKQITKTNVVQDSLNPAYESNEAKVKVADTQAVIFEVHETEKLGVDILTCTYTLNIPADGNLEEGVKTEQLQKEGPFRLDRKQPYINFEVKKAEDKEEGKEGSKRKKRHSHKKETSSSSSSSSDDEKEDNTPKEPILLDVTVVSATKLAAMDKGGKSDPFAVLSINGKGQEYKTEAIKENRNPEWNAEFHMEAANRNHDKLHIVVYDWDEHNDNDLIGNFKLPLKELPLDTPVEKDVELKKKHAHRKERGTVHLKIVAHKKEQDAPPVPAPAPVNHQAKTEKPKKVILEFSVVYAKDLAAMDLNGKSDPYVILKLNNDGPEQKTEVVKKNKNPVWNQDFTFELKDKQTDILHLSCYDWDDHNEHDLIGDSHLTLYEYVMDTPIERDVELKKEGGHRKNRGLVHVRFLFHYDNKDETSDEEPEPAKKEKSESDEEDAKKEAAALAANPPAPKPAPENLLLKLTVVNATKLAAMDKGGKSDPYCVLTINGEGQQYKTEVVKENRSPEWNQDFQIPLKSHENDKLCLACYDWDEHNDHDLIGQYELPLKEFPLDTPVEKDLALEKKNAHRKERGTVHLKFTIVKVEEKPAPAPVAAQPKKVLMDVTVVDAKDLAAMDIGGKSDPYVVLKLNKDGAPQKTEVIKKTKNPEWNQEFHMSLVDKKTDVLYVECYDWDDHNENDLIGNGEIKIDELALDATVDKYIELKKEGGFRKQRGTVHLRIHLHGDRADETSSDDEKKEAPVEEKAPVVVAAVKEQKKSSSSSSSSSDEEDRKKEQAELAANPPAPEEKVDPIVLQVVVVDAKGLPAMDLNGKADPYCALSVNGTGRQLRTGVVMKNKNPEWHQTFNVPIPNQKKDKLHITVYDWDEKNSNDLIGYAHIELKDVKLNTPVEQEVQLKKKHGLRKDRGVVHLKYTAYRPGEEPAPAPAPVPVAAVVPPPKKEEEKPKKVILDCTVVDAKDLAAMDLNGKSDPYVIVKINKNGAPQKTEVIKKTKNPAWNQEFHLDLVDKKTDVLVVECYDWDEKNTNDLIGNGEVKLADYALDTPVEVDVELKKEGGFRSKRGTVHLKFHFHEDRAGETDSEDEKKPAPVVVAAVKEQKKSSSSSSSSSDEEDRKKEQAELAANPPAPEEKVDPIVLQVVVVDAKGLPAMDLNGKADPYCALSVNGTGRQLRTGVVMKNKNPEWHQTFNVPIPNQKKDKLHITVYDWDEKNDNDLIGYRTIKLDQFKLNTPVEANVELKKKHGLRKDRGTVHLKFTAYRPGEEPKPGAPAVAPAHPQKAEYAPKKVLLDATVVDAKDLAAMDLNGKSDPYVILKLNKNGQPQKTEVIKKTKNPVWNQTFNFELVDKKTDVLIVECYDWDEKNANDLIGNGEVKLADYGLDSPISVSVELKKEGGFRSKRGTVNLKLLLHNDREGESDSEEEKPTFVQLSSSSSSSDEGEVVAAATREIKVDDGVIYGPVQDYTQDVYFRVFYEGKHRCDFDFNLLVLDTNEKRFGLSADKASHPQFLIKKDFYLPDEKKSQYPVHDIYYPDLKNKSVKVIPIIRTLRRVKVPAELKLEVAYYPDQQKFPDAPKKVIVCETTLKIRYRGEQLATKGIAFENGTSHEFDVKCKPQNNYTVFQWIRSMPADLAPRSDKWAAYGADQPQEETYKE
ncbi:C2 domain-containing protein family [Trichomonas vaginalis G3]|uniref:C2 domain-containing protein family n=1 Tax=Trichomonas vaginalis (strain ATCC PRA-98 / G3) TaxID=412133 RepID=UPI0021E58C4D|nr:C2 domain-containing protein family [Trichomonas vaginalis G3]KAI5517567.1 C2 domain-containing protein family [Trichomonas vaginalis G3]